MENRLKQRVSFSDPPSSQQEGFVRPIFQDEGIVRDDEHGTAVAAAALAIYSVEQAELLNLQKMVGDPISSTTQMEKRKKESISKNPSYGGNSKKKSFREDREGGVPIRLSSTEKSPIARYQEQKASRAPIQENNISNTWKKAQIEKILKRYEKIKLKIILWEGEKKTQAIVHMDRKKSEMKQKRAMATLHYQNKIARINWIAQRARANLEDKRKKEESKVREKANKIRKASRFLVKCFCFKFLMDR